MSNYKATTYKLTNDVLYYCDPATGIWTWHDSKGIKHEKESTFHYTLGNGKVKAFNTGFLPGNVPQLRNDNMKYTNLVGTCNGCSDGCAGIDGKHYDCYAMNSLSQHHNVCVVSWGANTWLFMNRTNEYFDQRRKAILKHKIKIVRVQESGEYPTKDLMKKDILDMWTYSDVDFYFYTKRFEWYREIKKEFGGKMPSNVHITISQWHKMYETDPTDAEFIYDDGSEPELDTMYHCNAVFINGRMNKEWHCNAPCKRCVLAKAGTKTAVYAHGNSKWKRNWDQIRLYLVMNPDKKCLAPDGKTWVGIDDLSK